MTMLRRLLVTLLLAVLPEALFAFSQCDAISNDPDQFSRYLSGIAAAQAPVKYHDVARQIKVVTKSLGDTLIPFATEQQGAKAVVFPTAFAKLVCQMALAQFLSNEGVEKDAFEQAAESAARCFSVGGARNACLLRFAAELSDRYGKTFAALPRDEQGTAVGLYNSALKEVLMHEYAHHFLDHLTRIRAQKISRPDAEFEADFFAILNGVQAGDPPSAMYYFFSGLSDLERHASQWATPDYESGSCRAMNVENITRFFGLAPMLLIDAAGGGGVTLGRNSVAMLRSNGKSQFSGAAPSLEPGFCARIGTVALSAAFEELRSLYLRAEGDDTLLFASPAQADTARTNRLIHDLSDLSERFRYMSPLAASMIAEIARRRGLQGLSLMPLSGEIDRLLASAAASGNFLSEDFGRLTQAQGFAILQEGKSLPVGSRLDRSMSLLLRAVEYNPAQTESWENLAFIALKHGDCAAAARYAQNSVDTLSKGHKKDLEGATFFAVKMKELSGDAAACKAEGASFHPYPGL